MRQTIIIVVLAASLIFQMLHNISLDDQIEQMEKVRRIEPRGADAPAISSVIIRCGHGGELTQEGKWFTCKDDWTDKQPTVTCAPGYYMGIEGDRLICKATP